MAHLDTVMHGISQDVGGFYQHLPTGNDCGCHLYTVRGRISGHLYMVRARISGHLYTLGLVYQDISGLCGPL